jgi:ferrochelatase
MKALLLINLGTPNSPKPSDVKKYLDEFLMDPLVIDIPWIARVLLVKGIILNTRPKKSAEAYEKVWTERGSPLLWHSQDLVTRVQECLYPKMNVFLAMRYGQPSMESVISKIKEANPEELIVLPLYPQYSLAATQSSIDELEKQLTQLKWRPKNMHVVRDFYDEGSFIGSFAERIAEEQKSFKPDHLLFSYHGVPERHCRKTDPSGSHCFSSPNCCDVITEANRNCYRAQCVATTRAICTALNLKASEYSLAFQSRLGRTPWIRPFTDEILPTLPPKGIKRVLVACPSFVADCLETLEEISIRAREDFIAAGGEELKLVASLNSTKSWAESVAEIATIASQGLNSATIKG